jgi:hypothetical protein
MESESAHYFAGLCQASKRILLVINHGLHSHLRFMFPTVMQRTKWTDRKFSFDFPEGWIYNILERLRGTAPRLHAMTTGLSNDHASIRIGSTWSIKEHIGHLYDLELLHISRIDEFIAGATTLSAADMSNAMTHAANHNAQPISRLIEQFHQRRSVLLDKFYHMPDDVQLRQALHPRLQVMMRPVDVAYFTAEHDDHHLCDIYNLLPA